MTEILEILKYLLPSLVVFATAYFLIREMLARDEKKKKLDVFLNNQKQIIPVRLQAYERLTLFLERITPESLVIRVNKEGMNNQALQQALLTTIRQEYEHNLAQQLYVSYKAWELVRNAKESTIQAINSVAIRISPQNSSMELSKAILEQHMESRTMPTKQALDFIKKEVATIF